MTDHAELRRLAKAATPGPWTLYVPEDYQGPDELPGYGVECAEGRAIVWGALEPETGCQFDRDAEFIAAANPQAILKLIAEVERLRIGLKGDFDLDAWLEWTREKDQIKAEIEALRRFAGEAYQVLGALDAPENVLDNASDAAHGVPLRHETLLPFFAEDYEALRKDAERWRYARTILPYEVIQDAQKDLESWNVGVSEAENKRCDEAIDAALEGATQ
ncbi:ead/Ea22-like family protein [Pseudomonas aeruginosa]